MSETLRLLGGLRAATLPAPHPPGPAAAGGPAGRDEHARVRIAMLEFDALTRRLWARLGLDLPAEPPGGRAVGPLHGFPDVCFSRSSRVTRPR